MKNIKLYEEYDNDPFEEEVENGNYRFMIVIGDWSDDGHGKYDYFVYSSNYPVEILRKSYKNSCKLTGLQFNHNQDYTGILAADWRRICTEYEDNTINKKAVDILERHGIDLSNFEDDYDTEDKYVDDIEKFAELILKFIKLSLPDFKFEETFYKKSELRHDIKPLNGYWNNDLNVQFGYGLFLD